MVDFPSTIADVTDALQNYVVAPLAAFGMGGFVFNAQGESVARLSADITDHYLEDNTAVQDQIAIRPKHITLKGYVGELVYNTTSQSGQVVSQLAEKLTEVTAFLPTLSAAAQQATAAATPPITASNVINASSNIYAVVKNALGAFGSTQNQQNAYNYFQSLMETKTLMGVQTPWEFMQNMAIESIIAVQDEKSIWISDFSVTLKQLRIVQTVTTAFSSGDTGTIVASNPTFATAAPVATGTITATDLAPVAAAQGAPVNNLGPTPGAPVPVANLPSFDAYSAGI